ncbi:MAG: hypothetical protein FWC79_00190 [Oscillospiraceae bacterium]|nr:hypothetical protein [Oscillospiraceae bacterium]
MVHAVTESNGGIFVVEQLNEFGEPVKMVAQSWTWRNGNRVCFDNVEMPDTLLQELSKENHEEIMQVYIDAGNKMIETDVRAMKKMLELGKITEAQYNQLVLQEVTAGVGCNDLIPLAEPNRFKNASLVSPKEASKMYRGMQNKTPWIDSRTSKILVENDEKTSKGKIEARGDIAEIPLKYTKVREIKHAEGKDIHSDLVKRILEMSKGNSKVKSLFEYEINDLEIRMSENDDWYVVAKKEDDAIRIEASNTVEGKTKLEGQKEIDRKLAGLEYAREMYKIILKGQKRGNKILYDEDNELSLEQLISKGIVTCTDGKIENIDLDKLQEEILALSQVIDQAKDERVIKGIESVEEDEMSI